MRRVLPLLLVLTVFAACSLGLRHRRGEDRDEIRAAHGVHVRAGLSCLRCHAGALTDPDSEPSKAARPARARPLLPTEAQCKACHDTRPEGRECGYCHTRPEAPTTYAAVDSELIFGHEEHVSRASGLCIRCHGSALDGVAGPSDGVNASSFEPRRRAPMSTCTDSCHNHSGQMRGMECSRCHHNLHRYGLSEVALVRHRPGFTHQHGAAARVDRDLCAQCHDATHCADCHQATPGLAPEVIEPTRVGLDFVHRGDFLARHPIEARVMQGTCTRCHGVGYCDGCHTASGIGGSVAPGSPHGPGWLDPVSPRGHSRQARRDILSCVACHESDAERTCVPCHRIGGPAGLNPHPPGFGAGMDPLRHAVCLTCHQEMP